MYLYVSYRVCFCRYVSIMMDHEKQTRQSRLYLYVTVSSSGDRQICACRFTGRCVGTPCNGHHSWNSCLDADLPNASSDHHADSLT